MKNILLASIALASIGLCFPASAGKFQTQDGSFEWEWNYQTREATLSNSTQIFGVTPNVTVYIAWQMDQDTHPALIDGNGNNPTQKPLKPLNCMHESEGTSYRLRVVDRDPQQGEWARYITLKQGSTTTHEDQTYYEIKEDYYERLETRQEPTGGFVCTKVEDGGSIGTRKFLKHHIAKGTLSGKPIICFRKPTLDTPETEQIEFVQRGKLIVKPDEKTQEGVSVAAGNPCPADPKIGGLGAIHRGGCPYTSYTFQQRQ